MADVFRIDPGHARVEAEREPKRAGDVIGPQIRGEPIADAVCDCEGLAFMLETEAPSARGRKFPPARSACRWRPVNSVGFT